jgi:hypothetical protein
LWIEGGFPVDPLYCKVTYTVTSSIPTKVVKYDPENCLYEKPAIEIYYAMDEPSIDVVSLKTAPWSAELLITFKASAG